MVDTNVAVETNASVRDLHKRQRDGHAVQRTKYKVQMEEAKKLKLLSGLYMGRQMLYL